MADFTLAVLDWALASSVAVSLDALRSANRIAEGLGLPVTQVRPAYEDALGRLAKSVRMPAGPGVEPGDDLEFDSAAARDGPTCPFA